VKTKWLKQHTALGSFGLFISGHLAWSKGLPARVSSGGQAGDFDEN